MAGKTIGQRVDRLERAVAALATETRKGFDRVAKQFAETDKRMHAMDKKTDERIDKLVIAIGEFIRRQNGRGK